MNYYGCAQDTIKEIDLEDYVACVTAAEIGNAPLEACKAQAVAARTFAAARGVLEGKVISDSAVKAQAFRAPRNNYKNCNAAAKETAGQILIYQGKPAAVVYTASNGGRTYSSQEVWGGVRDYLVAATDKWDTSSKKTGHGVGLSQNGAKNAANQGVTYDKILSFYYPNTTLTKPQTNYIDIVRQLKAQLEKVRAQIKKGL